MVNFKPFLSLSSFPKFKLKIKLGVLLLCLSFLSNYQPYLAFPPVKSNLVYAEITQQSQIASENLGMTFQLPHEGYITTTFSTYHPGIDLCSGLGMPIKPIAKGTVISAGYNFFGLGLVVEVDHGQGYRSLYAHMGKIYVEAGKEVNENSFLGEIGMTGNTSGPHTHLEVSKDGAKIDPRLILPAIRNYPREEDFAVVNSATPSAPIQSGSAVTIPASASARSKNDSVKTLGAEAPKPVIGDLKEIIPQTTTEETKPDLKQQSLDNVLNLASPKPSGSPLPQGGQLSLRNFSIFGFNKKPSYPVR